MKTTKLILSLQAALFVAAVSTASAHIGYTGRDFGSYTGSDITRTITNQNVSSDYGWADATDANLGDTHKTLAFKFNLASNAWVTLSFQGLAYTAGSNSYTALALPAFSLYRGVAAASTHDGSLISIKWRDTTYGTVISTNSNGETTTNSVTEGSLNALGDWKIGSDAGTTFADLSSFTYIGNAADGSSSNYGTPASSLTLADGSIVPNAAINGDGNADGVVTGSFYLTAGNYSVFAGGANYSGVNTNTAYGIQGSFTAIPEPSTWALLAVSLVMGGVVI
ncbi:MAG: hypothetical protein WAN16_06675, partial [Chthoniobacterales bacterium]